MLSATNVGGISEETVELSAGATLVVGTNASNKTSLLKSVQFALGAREVPIRSGADEARIRLEYGDRAVERTARRNGTGVEIAGEGWVSDPDERRLVERFACLLGTNPLRSAVTRGGDVESLLKAPMDIDALADERAAKLEEKRTLRAEVEDLADVEQRLSARREELADTRDRIDELEGRLETLYDRQNEDEGADEQLQSLREERTALRSERDRYREQIEELGATIDRLSERRDELEDELADVREVAAGTDVDDLKQRREAVREELAEITDRVDVLQSVLTANREMFDSEYTGALGYDPGLTGDEFTCWACGQQADREAFADTVEDLRELVERDKERRREREPELERLEDRIEAATEARRRVRELEAERDDVEQRRQESRDSREQKREELERLEGELADLDERIEARRDEQTAAQSDVADEIEEARVELRTSRREAERLEETVADLEADREARERKREEIAGLTEEIQSLTDRIENLEDDLRATFNDAMDDLLEALRFERIDRVRLNGDFEVVIAREVDGVVREDSVDHLAESEREIIGLVLGLAGFVAYDVDEISPVLLLDSLGAFDAARTERLVEYFADETDVLLAAVHPEAAADLPYDAVEMA